MNKPEIQRVLKALENGVMKAESALIRLKDLSHTDIGNTKIENHQSLPNGYPEGYFE